MTLSNFVIRTERIGEPIPSMECDQPELLHAYHKKYLRPTMQEGKEHLHVVIFDTRLHAIGHHLVSMGSLNECTAHPREVLRPVLIAGAYGFAVMHNHPSGDPSPSRADEAFTRRIVEASNLLGLKFLDHVIVGDSRTSLRPFYSFREAGIIA
jgi:DNA repair protein RadC